jgi:hypothetical protein
LEQFPERNLQAIADTLGLESGRIFAHETAFLGSREVMETSVLESGDWYRWMLQLLAPLSYPLFELGDNLRYNRGWTLVRDGQGRQCLHRVHLRQFQDRALGG